MSYYYCSYCGTAGTQHSLPWSCGACMARYCTQMCMQIDKSDHDNGCLEEPVRITFSSTYYNRRSTHAGEATKQNFMPTSLRKSQECRMLPDGGGGIVPSKREESSSSSNNEVPVCEHFLKNSCKFGDSCWKLHPTNGKAEVKTVKNEKKIVLNNNDYVGQTTQQKDNHAKSYMSVKKTQDGEGIKQHTIICKHFQRGACTYGDACYKTHEMSSAKIDEIIQLKKVNNSDAIDIVPVCEHFQRGACSYGETCYKKHVKTPLFKAPYAPKGDEIVEKCKTDNLHDIFLSDSEEDPVEIQKLFLHLKKMNSVKIPKNSPINLFEVLENDALLREPEGDEEEELEELKTEKVKIVVIQDVSTIISTAEKKRSKKEKRKQQALQETLKKIEALKVSGNNEFKAGRYSSAVKVYTEATNLAGANIPIPAVHNNRCAAFILLGKFNCALKDGRKVVEVEPNNAKAHHRVVKCCVALGKVEEGRRSFEKILDESDPEIEGMKKDLDTVDRLYIELVKLSIKKSYKLALDKVTQVLEISTHSSQFLILQAKFFALEKDITSARKALDKLDMKQQNVKTSLFHFTAGLCSYYEDDMQRAISGFGEAKKDLPEAEEWHEKAMTMHNAFVAGNKGVKLGGSYSSDMASIDNGLATDKDNTVYMANMFYTRALLNIRYKKIAQAVTDCDHAIQYDPAYYKAWLKRGSLHLEMEKYTEAVEDLTEAHRLNKTPEALRYLEDAKKRKIKAEKRKPSHYQILGVDKNATSQEIKKAYRSKAKEFHPDKHALASKEEQGEMEGKMKEIAAANQCLSDPTKKLEYDRRLERMLRDDDSDMEEYDSEDDDEFAFNVNDFFFHLFGMYLGGGGSFRSRSYRR